MPAGQGRPRRAAGTVGVRGVFTQGGVCCCCFPAGQARVGVRERLAWVWGRGGKGGGGAARLDDGAAGGGALGGGQGDVAVAGHDDGRRHRPPRPHARRRRRRHRHLEAGLPGMPRLG